MKIYFVLFITYTGNIRQSLKESASEGFISSQTRLFHSFAPRKPDEVRSLSSSVLQ